MANGSSNYIWIFEFYPEKKGVPMPESKEKEIKESIREKRANAVAKPCFTESELYYLYKHLYQGKEKK